MQQVKELGIVMLANESWEAVGVRQRELATWLSDEWKVLFVDRFNYRRFPFRHWRSYLQLLHSFQFPCQLREQLWHWEPPPLFGPGWHQGWVFVINRLILKLFLWRALRRLGVNAFVLFCCGLNDVQFVGRIGEFCSVADITDDITGFAQTNVKLALETEKQLIQKVHITLTTALGLYESKQTLAHECYLVRNGVSPDRFRSAFENRLKVPPDIQNIPKPRIGFVGVIAEWVDIDLLAKVASLRPNWSFVLIGPVKNNVVLNGLPPNIYLLGGKRYEMVPAYLQAVDVAIILLSAHRL